MTARLGVLQRLFEAKMISAKQFAVLGPTIEDEIRTALEKAGREGYSPPVESIHMSPEVEAQLRKALL